MTFVTGHVTTENNTSGNRPAAETTSAKIEVSSYFYWKGIIGSMVTVILLIPGIPIMMALIVLVRLTSRGPGIYRQERVGRHGRTFNMYKIRTMRQDAESRGGPLSVFCRTWGWRPYLLPLQSGTCKRQE